MSFRKSDLNLIMALTLPAKSQTVIAHFVCRLGQTFNGGVVRGKGAPMQDTARFYKGGIEPNVLYRQFSLP